MDIDNNEPSAVVVNGNNSEVQENSTNNEIDSEVVETSNLDNHTSYDEESENEFKKFSTWALILGTTVMTVIMIVVGVLFYKMIFPEASDNNVETSQSITQLETTAMPIVDRYDFVHKMTNGVIIAKDGEKWGTKEITIKNIDKGIELFTGVDDRIVKYLNLWREGNFDKSVEFHNYVWAYLNGTIGEAISLDKAMIENVKSNLGL